MGKILVDNVFNSSIPGGVLIVGKLVDGEIQAGASLLLEDVDPISIKQVEADTEIFPGLTIIRLEVFTTLPVKWHTLRGKLIMVD